MTKTNLEYKCSKCGFIGNNKGAMAQHKKVPVTGICRSLDGLVISINRDDRGKYYAVVIKAELATKRGHRAIYDMDAYTKRGLEVIYSYRDTLEELVGLKLYYHHQENSYPSYTELSTAEFKKVTRRLRKKYPEKYAHKKFNRLLKYRGPI